MPESHTESAMRSKTSLIGILLMALAGPATAQVPPDYSLVQAEPLPDSLIESYAQGRFEIVVSRSATTTRERELLAVAENLLPNVNLIEEAVEEHLSEIDSAGQWPANFEEARAIPGDRWWWMDFGGLLPFALHGDAVHHYINLVRSYALAEDAMGRSATLRYSAHVTDVGEEGFRVALAVSFSMNCGGRCGFGFAHKRIVVFDESGAVIAVQGDGQPDAWIS